MIKLAKPYIPKEAIQKVTDVLMSGNLVQGEYVKKFEYALQRYLGVKHAILVSSGTAALHLSMLALGIKTNDEVIVPAFTFPATANAVENTGAKPVLVDITLDDFCIDVTKIEEKITSKTKAIIPVHEFGQSVEIDKLLEISREFNLEIVEDAACALGTEFNNKKVGTFGTLGCFSFHPRKTITTGEGGAVVTNDDALAGKINALRNHGISMGDFVYAGYNYRMTDFQAALGLYQLNEIEKILDKRISIAKRYNHELSSVKWIREPAQLRDRKHVYQTYHIIIDNRLDRDQLLYTLKKAGIEVNLGAQALHCLPYYKKKYKYKDVDFLNAEKAYKKGIALPIGMHIENNDVEFIIGKIKKAMS